MCSVVHSCPSKLFSRLYPQWPFWNTHVKTSYILLLKPLNAFPLGLGQRSNSLMVHKICCGQNLLWSEAYLHTTFPNSLHHLPSVPHHHACSHPRGRALHIPPILFQLVPTYTNPSFFFGCFLKNVYSNIHSTALIFLTALTIATIYIFVCGFLIPPYSLLDFKHIRILDELGHIVSQALHSALPKGDCQ